MDKISFALLVCAAFTNAIGSSVMKYAYGGNSSLLSSGIAAAFLKILLNPLVILGLGMFGISFFLMAAALSRTELTLAYPFMSALVYIILFLVGFFFFHERITLLRAAGMALILAGITLLSMKN